MQFVTTNSTFPHIFYSLRSFGMLSSAAPKALIASYSPFQSTNSPAELAVQQRGCQSCTPNQHALTVL
jgi:hypothetical protein